MNVVVHVLGPAVFSAAAVCAPLVPYPASASTPPRACDLLSRSVAARLLGAPATPVSNPAPGAGLTECAYSSPKGGLDVTIGSWKTVYGHNQNFCSDPLPGLGDEAHFGFFNHLCVRKGTRGMEIEAGGPPNSNFSGDAAEAEWARQKALDVKTAKALLPQL